MVSLRLLHKENILFTLLLQLHSAKDCNVSMCRRRAMGYSYSRISKHDADLWSLRVIGQQRKKHYGHFHAHRVPNVPLTCLRHSIAKSSFTILKPRKGTQESSQHWLIGVPEYRRKGSSEWWLSQTNMHLRGPLETGAQLKTHSAVDAVSVALTC